MESNCRLMSDEERIDLIKRANKAWKEGDFELSSKLKGQLPIAPHLAQFYLEEYGKEELLAAGFNLSDAEAEYGKNWLD